MKAPDLFGAIHIAVPLLDMKRYHKLLAGASWMAEYGDPDTDDWEQFLYKYSPYHNIDAAREKYPHVLLTTSTRDDRVHPAHARKMVKKLWDLGEGKDWPVFYYENIEGGHGGAGECTPRWNFYDFYPIRVFFTRFIHFRCLNFRNSGLKTRSIYEFSLIRFHVASSHVIHTQELMMLVSFV